MTSNEVVLRVIRALEELAIPYMLVGSYSSNAYGQARSTQDADFVLELGNRSPSDLARALGSEFRLDPQSVVEFNTFTTRYIARHVKSAFKIEFFLLSDDPFDNGRFGRRVQLDFLGTKVFLPSAEDVVIMKLRWAKGAGRQKDVLDALNVLAAQQGRLDMDYIRQWCDRHGSRGILDELLGKIASAI